MKFLKNYPFLLMIAFSTIVIGIIGYLGKNNIYSDYSASFKAPQLAAVFEGIGEGKYPWMITLQSRSDKTNQAIQPVMSDINTLAENEDNSDVKGALSESYGNGDTISTGKAGVDQPSSSISGADIVTDTKSNTTKAASGDKKSDKSEKGRTDDKAGAKDTSGGDKKTEALGKNSSKEQKSGQDAVIPDTKAKDNTASASDNQSADTSKHNAKNTDKSDSNADRTIDKLSDIKKGEKTDTCKFETVQEDYFDDALFIGDSRTVGLSEYSTLTNSTFYADVGLTIYDIFERKIADLDGSKVTIPEALKKKQFKKIYIMVGINELGRGTTETFVEEYKKVIDKIKKLQPEAIIFIEGIMNVAKEKSDTDPIFNNINIKDKNEHIAQLADNKSVFYIDVNESITDKSGNLPSKYTFDDIHLKAAYYEIWTDFLVNHGVEIK